MYNKEMSWSIDKPSEPAGVTEWYLDKAAAALL